GDEALGLSHPEQTLDRGAPVLAERQGVVVDVHEDEPPARLLVDPPPVPHRVLERLVDVGVGPGDRVAEALRESPVEVFAEGSARAPRGSARNPTPSTRPGPSSGTGRR